jgi:hypothetical protein
MWNSGLSMYDNHVFAPLSERTEGRSFAAYSTDPGGSDRLIYSCLKNIWDRSDGCIAIELNGKNSPKY